MRRGLAAALSIFGIFINNFVGIFYRLWKLKEFDLYLTNNPLKRQSFIILFISAYGSIFSVYLYFLLFFISLKDYETAKNKMPYPSRSSSERRKSCDLCSADRCRRDRKIIDVAGGSFREWAHGLWWEVPHSLKLEVSLLCFSYFTVHSYSYARVLLVQSFDFNSAT